MLNKNIIFNMTLESYNKKYRNRKYRLLKFTKKEVKEFDLSHKTDINNFLLKGRRWALIGDTYYEIPKAPRYTWFRNLNGVVQAGVCLLGIGAVTASVVTPIVLLSNKTNGSITPTITGDGKDLIKSVTFDKQSDGSFIGKIELKETATIEEIDEISILVTENDKTTELKRDKDYTLDTSSGDVKINAGVIKTNNPKITVNVAIAEKTKKYTIIAIAEQGGSVSPEEQEYKIGEQATVTAIPDSGYKFNGWYENGEKIEDAEATYSFEVTCKRKLIAKFDEDIGELDIYGEDAVGIGDKTSLTCAGAIGTVTWDITDKTIATISKSGVVTGRSEGTTTVTAVDAEGNRGELDIEVLPYHAYLCFDLFDHDKTAAVSWNRDYSIPLDGKIIIPDTITVKGVTYTVDTINRYGFYDCDKLTSITLPQNLKTIDGYSFYNCSSLTSITIPDSVESIKELSFYKCSGLNKAKFEKNTCWFTEDSIWETPEHTEEENAEALKSIGELESWEKVTEVEATYKYHGFKIVEGEEIETEESEDIQYYKIECNNVNECTFAKIPSKYNEKNVTGIYIDNDGYGGFQDAWLLKSVVFEQPCKFTEIAYASFWSCTRLQYITLPEGITSINKNAFYNCESLKSINIPSSVNYIGTDAFDPGYQAETSLKEVDFKDTASTWTIGEIKDWTPGSKEYNAKMIIDHLNEEWSKNIPVEAELKYKGYKIDEDTGEEVEVINDNDAQYFKVHCDNLYECEHALIPAYHPDYETKPIIGLSENAFNQAYKLNSIEFEKQSNIKTFGEFAFSNCISLKEIEIPETVTNIDEGCFIACDGLTSITIPNSVNYIGMHCFASCTSLTSITLEQSSKWNIIDTVESEVFATYTAGDPSDNAIALTKMLDEGYVDFEWRKFGKKEKFLDKLDEWVIGENGFNKATTEYSTADISNVKINGVDITNYDVAYYSDGEYRWLTISKNDDSEIYFDFGDPYYNSELKSDKFLDTYLSPNKIHYEINDGYIEYEVDEDYFEDAPETNTLRFLRVNKFGYIEKAIIYDDFGEGEKWTEFSVNYNKEPHEFNNVKVEYIGGTTCEAVQTIKKDNYYKIKCEDCSSGYEYEFTINNSDGPIDLTTIIEDFVVKDYADKNMSFTLSADKTKLTIIPDANTDINVRFKCKANVENAKFKFELIQ